MSDAVMVALITLAGTIITVVWGNKKNAKTHEDYKNLTIYRIEQLEKKVEKHNNVVERTFKLEQDVKDINDDVKSLKNLHLN